MKMLILLFITFSSLVAASPVEFVRRQTVKSREVIPESWHEARAVHRRGVAADRMTKIVGSSRDGAAGARLGQAMFEIIDKFKNDDDQVKRRIEFVHNSLDKYGKKHPGFNIIVVHTDVGYDKPSFIGEWGKAHEEVPIHIGGGSKGYDIFWFKKGTFNRHGDGGWINWGYTGTPKRDGGKLTY
ncbi:hypothetical protein BDQ17DRAFT_1371220 [Cyathus striatus]|nr:hypothetical protein BDQ17DRAFT_1371220 [Cyathus striatus]